MEEIQFQLAENRLTAEEFIQLKIAAGFWERPVHQIETALKNGLFTVSAICEGETIGMGRLVGDGAMYWYLQDIIVLPGFQGKGIGKSIVSRLLAYIETAALPGTQAYIGLTAVPGKEGFYERFGFSLCQAGMLKELETDRTEKMY